MSHLGAICNRESPDVGLAPTGVWRVPPPSPIAIGGPFPQAKTLPSPPSPSLFPPPPLALFAMLRDGAAQSGVGGVVSGFEGGGGWRGGPSSGTWGQTHIWGYSTQSFARKGCLLLRLAMRVAQLEQLNRQQAGKLAQQTRELSILRAELEHYRHTCVKRYEVPDQLTCGKSPNRG